MGVQRHAPKTCRLVVLRLWGWSCGTRVLLSESDTQHIVRRRLGHHPNSQVRSECVFIDIALPVRLCKSEQRQYQIHKHMYRHPNYPL